MSVQLIGVLGICCLLALLLARVPIAVAMGLVGFAGYGVVNGWSNAFYVFGSLPFDIGSQYFLASTLR